jgi:hypothetical protein
MGDSWAWTAYRLTPAIAPPCLRVLSPVGRRGEREGIGGGDWWRAWAVGSYTDGPDLTAHTPSLDRIWTVRSWSGGPRWTIPLRYVTFSKESPCLIEINPQSCRSSLSLERFYGLVPGVSNNDVLGQRNRKPNKYNWKILFRVKIITETC